LGLLSVAMAGFLHCRFGDNGKASTGVPGIFAVSHSREITQNGTPMKLRV
jgi:hypothetical protein